MNKIAGLSNFIDMERQLQEEVWDLYVGSFPHYEIWSRSSLEKASSDPDCHTKVMLDEHGYLMALLFYWTHANLLYIEFLAVKPDMRGRNIGTQLINQLTEDYQGYEIILEIDPPQDSISIRRQHFYERIGFVMNDYEHIHPSYMKGEKAHPHDLKIMSYGGLVSESEFNKFRQFLFGIIEKYGE